MKENKKLVSEIIEDIRRDMTDEEVLALLAVSYTHLTLPTKLEV